MNNLEKYRNTMRLMTFVVGALMGMLSIILLFGIDAPQTHEVSIFHVLIVKLFGIGFLLIAIKIFQILYHDFTS